MEILQFLLKFFIQNSNTSWLKPIFELFQNNSFNLGETLKNLQPETLEPIIKNFMDNFATNKNSTDFSVEQDYGLSPIANIGDKQIVYTLNKYFNS